eukprot:TRINITY_DN4602_c0_g1_i1.p1 TRINITY_DN4602_c0_g1~~TRINITY_DN4602_c0_g1_i1.p1  ORF type:complete len:1731 (+),score=426.66 TRINITY_DN4602_c0_g1_i1:206-5398(+)
MKLVKRMFRLRQVRDIDSADRLGRTALHWTCVSGSTEAAAFLLANGASINRFDKSRRTPLLLAVANSHPGLVQLLLSRGACPVTADAERLTALHIACSVQCIEAIPFLIQYGGMIDADDEKECTPLHYCGDVGAVDCAKLLIDAGADIDRFDCNGQTPVHHAVENNHMPMVQLLCANKADVNCRDQDGVPPLLVAVRLGTVEIAATLCQAGARVNISAHHVMKTPLHEACIVGNSDVARLLLKYGANVNARDYQGRTPLHYAVSSDSKEKLVKLLLSYKPPNSSLDPTDTMTGDTNLTRPLHFAAYYGSVACVELLLKSGVDAQLLDRHGRSSLHWACGTGKLDAVRILVEHGMDVNVMDCDRFTPLDWALENSHAAVRDYLRLRQAKQGWELDKAVAVEIQAYQERQTTVKHGLWSVMLATLTMQRTWRNFVKRRGSEVHSVPEPRGRRKGSQWQADVEGKRSKVRFKKQDKTMWRRRLSEQARLELDLAGTYSPGPDHLDRVETFQRLRALLLEEHALTRMQLRLLYDQQEFALGAETATELMAKIDQQLHDQRSTYKSNQRRFAEYEQRIAELLSSPAARSKEGASEVIRGQQELHSLRSDNAEISAKISSLEAQHKVSIEELQYAQTQLHELKHEASPQLGEIMFRKLPDVSLAAIVSERATEFQKLCNDAECKRQDDRPTQREILLGQLEQLAHDLRREIDIMDSKLDDLQQQAHAEFDEQLTVEANTKSIVPVTPKVGRYSILHSHSSSTTLSAQTPLSREIGDLTKLIVDLEKQLAQREEEFAGAEHLRVVAVTSRTPEKVNLLAELEGTRQQHRTQNEIHRRTFAKALEDLQHAQWALQAKQLSLVATMQAGRHITDDDDVIALEASVTHLKEQMDVVRAQQSTNEAAQTKQLQDLHQRLFGDQPHVLASENIIQTLQMKRDILRHLQQVEADYLEREDAHRSKLLLTDSAIQSDDSDDELLREAAEAAAANSIATPMLSRADTEAVRKIIERGSEEFPMKAILPGTDKKTAVVVIINSMGLSFLQKRTFGRDKEMFTCEFAAGGMAVQTIGGRDSACWLYSPGRERIRCTCKRLSVFFAVFDHYNRAANPGQQSMLSSEKRVSTALANAELPILMPRRSIPNLMFGSAERSASLDSYLQSLPQESVEPGPPTREPVRDRFSISLPSPHLMQQADETAKLREELAAMRREMEKMQQQFAAQQQMFQQQQLLQQQQAQQQAQVPQMITLTTSSPHTTPPTAITGAMTGAGGLTVMRQQSQRWSLSSAPPALAVHEGGGSDPFAYLGTESQTNSVSIVLDKELASAIQTRIFIVDARSVLQGNSNKDNIIITVTPDVFQIQVKRVFRQPRDYLQTRTSDVRFEFVLQHPRAFWMSDGHQRLYCTSRKRDVLARVLQMFGGVIGGPDTVTPAMTPEPSILLAHLTGSAQQPQAPAQEPASSRLSSPRSDSGADAGVQRTSSLTKTGLRRRSTSTNSHGGSNGSINTRERSNSSEKRPDNVPSLPVPRRSRSASSHSSHSSDSIKVPPVGDPTALGTVSPSAGIASPRSVSSRSSALSSSRSPVSPRTNSRQDLRSTDSSVAPSPPVRPTPTTVIQPASPKTPRGVAAQLSGTGSPRSTSARPSPASTTSSTRPAPIQRSMSGRKPTSSPSTPSPTASSFSARATTMSGTAPHKTVASSPATLPSPRPTAAVLNRSQTSSGSASPRRGSAFRGVLKALGIPEDQVQ